MVWAVTASVDCERHLFPGRMNSADYVEMLAAEFLPFSSDLGGPNWQFQQDNAPIHTSAETRQWFAENNFRLVSHPAKSPDLNPMENVQGILVRIIYGNGKQYENVSQLKEAIKKAAFEVDNCELQRLSEAMPNRVVEVIQNNGSYTSY